MDLWATLRIKATEQEGREAVGEVAPQQILLVVRQRKATPVAGLDTLEPCLLPEQGEKDIAEVNQRMPVLAVLAADGVLQAHLVEPVVCRLDILAEAVAAQSQATQTFLGVQQALDTEQFHEH